MNNQPINTSPGSLHRAFILLLVLAAFGSVSLVRAQTTSFTYQGRLTDSGTAANATYDMQFKLFDTATVGAGNQIGSAITNGAVLVSGGVFTVQLDFGATAFSGADRYLEIGVRLAGDNSPYTLLSPRQQLTSAVYAIRAGSSTNADTATNASTATNAIQLGGVAASQFVQTNDARLTDSRMPTAGSSNYIQNTNSQQGANFNISGNGTAGGTLSANAINTTTSYSIGGSSVLSISGGGAEPTGNTFTGIGAGIANTFSSPTGGLVNSFYGSRSGAKNISGYANSFFGANSGESNTTGFANTFVGYAAGISNDNGEANSFFGFAAGVQNKSGKFNAFLGTYAGNSNETGGLNTFVGHSAGLANKTGSELTFLGFEAGTGGVADLTNATAIGARAEVAQSNSLVLGSIDGKNGATHDTNIGIGTTAPNARFHIAVNAGNIVMGHAGCNPGFTGIGFGSSLSGCTNYSLLGDGTNTYLNRPTGGSIQFRENNATQMSIASGGLVSITTWGSGGTDHLCRNPSNQISNCSSSLRYKTNIQPFIGGLSLLNRLRPITFDWKQGGMHDLGFGAEDIAAIEPLLATRNDKGEVEGVKYDRITAVLVNAIKEQQKQIEDLKKLVCQRKRRAAVCR